MDIIMVFAENIMSVVIRVAGKAFNTKIVYEIKVFHLTRSDFVEARAQACTGQDSFLRMLRHFMNTFKI